MSKMSDSTAVPTYDNAAAFQYEDESAYEEPQDLHRAHASTASGVTAPQFNQRAPQLPDRSFNKGRGKSTTMDDIAVIIEKESTLPLVMTSEATSYETSFKKHLDAINGALDEAFTIISIPFTLVVVFIHHVIRFILRGLVRPLMVDSLLMFVEYFWRPFFNTMIKPFFISLHGGSSAFIEWILICIKPLTILCKSIRCVEINYVKNGRIQEV